MDETHKMTPQPAEVDDSDVGAGAKVGVWVAGLIIAVVLLYFVFFLG